MNIERLINIEQIKLFKNDRRYGIIIRYKIFIIFLLDRRIQFCCGIKFVTF